MNVIKLFVGRFFNKIPYRIVPKIGGIYHGYEVEIVEYNHTLDKKDWIFRRVYAIVSFAIKKIKFYKDFYKAKGFSLDQLKTFDDIVKIPIITKEILMTVPLEERSVRTKTCYLANTGGSSGIPLSFFKESKHRIKEWVYYNHAWKSIGYRKNIVRLKFVGRQNIMGLSYDFKRNQIQANVYEPYDKLLSEISRINQKGIIRFLSGYPSALYEFALYCETHINEFYASNLHKSIEGISLNSEYPHPQFLEVIKRVFSHNIISSYGHTEGLCLGFDFGDGMYHSVQSYGYTETVKMVDGEHLVGTCYDNYASPLIRYDTNDIVDNTILKDGIIQSFKMTNGGRNGQYIVDANGHKLPLTGVIFGKHHRLFNYCSQIQVSQREKGAAIIYYVPKQKLPDGFDPNEYFDTAGMKIKFSYKRINSPIRTKSGKILLLININDQLS